MEPPSESLVAKAPKKSPLISRLVIVVFVMVCGVYICSICVQQQSSIIQVIKGISPQIEVININSSCLASSGIEESEIPFVHFPQPETFSREECECNPVRNFVILSMQRSGSGWFETLLNSHINVSSNGELLGASRRRTNATTIEKNLDKVFNLDWFTSASKNECSAAVGFKWMLNQGLLSNHEDIEKYFKKNGVHVIFLFRRNMLRRMISVLANSYDRENKPLNGTHKSHVHSPLEAKVLAKYKPKINITMLMPKLKDAEKNAAKAIKYFNTTRHILLYYEDVVNNRTKLKEVQEFLRLPVRELTSRQVKIHKGHLSKQVQNWDEVQNALKGSPYERLLDLD